MPSRTFGEAGFYEPGDAHKNSLHQSLMTSVLHMCHFSLFPQESGKATATSNALMDRAGSGSPWVSQPSSPRFSLGDSLKKAR